MSTANNEIPLAVFDYRLGNRSALDWVIDQYRAKTDKRSGISSDPNRRDDPQYIVRRRSQPDAPRQAGGLRRRIIDEHRQLADNCAIAGD